MVAYAQTFRPVLGSLSPLGERGSLMTVNHESLQLKIFTDGNLDFCTDHGGMANLKVPR